MPIISKAGILLSIIFSGMHFCSIIDQRIPSFASEQVIIPDTASGIVLEKIKMPDLKLIYIPDTANTSHEFPRKMSKNYGDLFIFSASQNLDARRLLIFYHTTSWPCVFETALEVNEFPKDLHKKIRSKTLNGGSVLVAHYKGPYEQISKAYGAINKWMADNNKIKRDMPFEMHLNDPALITNKNELRADVFQPIQ